MAMEDWVGEMPFVGSVRPSTVMLITVEGFKMAVLGVKVKVDEAPPLNAGENATGEEVGLERATVLDSANPGR